MSAAVIDLPTSDNVLMRAYEDMISGVRPTEQELVESCHQHFSELALSLASAQTVPQVGDAEVVLPFLSTSAYAV